MDVKAEMIIAGMFREGDPALNEDLVPNAVAEITKHFVVPELRRRGIDPDHATGVRQALVTMDSNGGAAVQIDDEAAFVALAGTGADLVAPSDVFVGQIIDLWPDGIDPNVGWTGFATAAGGGRVLVCDFRRDRESVRELVVRSAEFLESARLSLGSGLIAPALEHLNTAAELAVIVLIRLQAEKVGRDHRKRREWLVREARYSGVPARFADAFDDLATVRNSARYAEGAELPSVAETDRLVEVVGEFVVYAERRAT